MSAWAVLLSLPWRTMVDTNGMTLIVNSSGTLVANHLWQVQADAILKAVSCHEDLVEACEMAVKVWPNQMHGSLVEAALAKAKEL